MTVAFFALTKTLHNQFPDVAKVSLDAVVTSAALQDRVFWTPLFPQEEHLKVKALACLQLDT